MATISPRDVSGRRIDNPNRSADSQTGPTTSYTSVFSDADVKLQTACRAPYNAGRMRSFIPASNIANFLPFPIFTYKTLEIKKPHCATRALPGSKCTFCPFLSSSVLCTQSRNKFQKGYIGFPGMFVICNTATQVNMFKTDIPLFKPTLEVIYFIA